MGMKDTFKVVISAYSLAEGEVGRPIGRTPIVREHENIEDAMRDIYEAIKKNEGHIDGEGKSLFIYDGCRKRTLLRAYVDTFGVEPVTLATGELSFTMLFEKGKKS